MIQMKKLILLTLLFYGLATQAQLIKSNHSEQNENRFSLYADMLSSEDKFQKINFSSSTNFKLSNASNQPSDKNDIYLPVKVMQSSSFIVRIDSVYSWTWNSQTNSWNYSDKTIDFIYDSNNQVVEQTTLLWDGSGWTNDYRYTYTYDSNNNLIEELEEDYVNNSWENGRLVTYTFNSNNEQIAYLEQNWSGNMWNNIHQELYTYDANSNQTGTLSQDWNSNAWENTSMVTNTFNANQFQTGALFEIWNGSNWINSRQSTFTYDVNNYLISLLTENWSGSAWENSSQRTNSYDSNNNLITSLVQIWNGFAWVNSNKYNYTYSAAQVVSTQTGQSWINNLWETIYIVTYSRDVDLNLEALVLQFADSSGQLVYSDSLRWYQHNVIGIDETDGQGLLVNAYPNPFHNKLQIELTMPIDRLQEVIISDLLGKDIFRQSISNSEIAIDTDEFPAGIYFIRVTNKPFISFKLIKL